MEGSSLHHTESSFEDAGSEATEISAEDMTAIRALLERPDAHALDGRLKEALEGLAQAYESYASSTAALLEAKRRYDEAIEAHAKSIADELAS